MAEKGQESSGESKINEFLSAYKFPLIFASAGLVFIIGAAIVIIRQNRESANVVFITQASESAKMKVRIDVVGAVIKPDVYELEEGSRVSDALTAAGGFNASADREWVAKNLNRAAKIIDGGKIYIPTLHERSSSPLSNISNPGNLLGVSSAKINLNTASSVELESLPGIGPVLASKIISGRPYQTIEELKTRKIVGNALFEKIKDQISL